jgi:hypothetical protein
MIRIEPSNARRATGEGGSGTGTTISSRHAVVAEGGVGAAHLDLEGRGGDGDRVAGPGDGDASGEGGGADRGAEPVPLADDQEMVGAAVPIDIRAASPDRQVPPRPIA